MSTALDPKEVERIKAVIAASAALHAPHRSSGVKPDPRARLLVWPETGDPSTHPHSDVELVDIWTPDGTRSDVVLTKSQTDHVSASDEWPSRSYVLSYLMNVLKYSYVQAYELFPTLYHFVYGVATCARIVVEGIKYIYVCTPTEASLNSCLHSPMISLPYRFVNRSKETILDAAMHEFGERWGRPNVKLRDGVAFGPHTTVPGITFVAMVDIVSDPDDIKPCYSWAGNKSMVRIPETAFRAALNDSNDDDELRTALSVHGISYGKVQIDSDIVDPLMTMFEVYPD